MGNCSLKGSVLDVAKGHNSVQIMTDSGSILELEGPKLVKEVLNDFPGYDVFRQGHLSTPLFAHEQLVSGQFYYLLPVGEKKLTLGTADRTDTSVEYVEATTSINGTDEVRMSSSAALDLVTNLANGSSIEVLPPPKEGVWRVKLMINTKQLEEILSEQENTEALIEQMRMAASSATFTPRRTKSYWGVVTWKPILTKVFKLPIDYQNIKSCH